MRKQIPARVLKRHLPDNPVVVRWPDDAERADLLYANTTDGLDAAWKLLRNVKVLVLPAVEPWDESEAWLHSSGFHVAYRARTEVMVLPGYIPAA